MIDFFAPPQNALKFMQAKKPQIHFDYDEIMHEAHSRTFTIAKITDLSLLSDIQASLNYALQNGLKFDEWRKSLEPTLTKKGWLGDISVTNPRTGEIKQIHVGSRRLKNIYYTNMRTAYAHAAYDAAMNSEAQYFRYVSKDDAKTRPAHAALHGLILPKNHPFWEKNYPPNAWNCRCKVRAYTAEELASRGWSVSESAPEFEAHKDWAYNPGRGANLEQIYAQKLENIDKQSELYKNAAGFFDELERRRNLYVWQQGLDEAIDELLIKKNAKSPINAFQIGILKQDIINKTSEILGVKFDNGFIMGDKSGILHVRSERKGAYNQALRIDELKKIVVILDDKNTRVSVDTEFKNLIFWFNDEQDETKINKIVVDLNYKLKKFGVTNYMVTAAKIDKKDAKNDKYVKIK